MTPRQGATSRVAATLALVAAGLSAGTARATYCPTPVIRVRNDSVSAVPPFPPKNARRIVDPVTDRQLDTALSSGTWSSLPMLAVDPGARDRMYLINEDTVMRTEDGGCRWTDVFHLPHLSPTTVAPSAEVDRFYSVTAGPGSVYVVSQPYWDNTGDSRLRVFRSTDRGAHFTEADNGLPPAPGVGVVVPAPSNPKVLYFAARLGIGRAAAVNVLYRSADGGGTWTQATASHAPSPSGCCWVDPLNPNELWASVPSADDQVDQTSGASAVAAVHSTDGGATFSEVTVADTDCPAYLAAVQHLKGHPARLLVSSECPWGSKQKSGFLVADSGKAFQRLKALPPDVAQLGHFGDTTNGPRWDLRMAMFGDRPGVFVAALRKQTPAGTCIHFYRYDPDRAPAWRQLTSFGETHGPSVLSCEEAFLVSGPGARSVPRQLEQVYVYGSGPHWYILGYRGAV